MAAESVNGYENDMGKLYKGVLEKKNH